MKICTSEREYIDLVAVPAQRVCKRYGYLPSVLIAQSCLENGYGIPSYWDNPEIEKLLEANNTTGIKSELLNKSWDKYTVWNGESITKNTPEEYNGKMVTIKDSFRAYDSIERSFCDFLLFLKYASNYGEGGTPKYGDKVLSLKDPATLIRMVSSLGYATGSTYSSSVMRIINKHDLTYYDNLSDVEPTNILPGDKAMTNIKKLENRAIIDITDRNRNQVPRGRNGNPIDYIVCHYLGVPNADNPDLYGGGYGGHYNITRDGKVYKAANPRTAVVWHCGGKLQGEGGHTFYQICTNYNSIGIECGVCYDGAEREPSGDSDKWFFTEATQESLVWLVSKLMDEYGIPENHVIRHFDVTGKTCPNPYVKNNGLNGNWTWNEFKSNLAQYRQDGTITIPNRSTPTPSPSKGYLSKGDTGEDVKTMQMMLNACGFNCGNADGIFGNKTESALSAFRQAHKMTATPKYTDKVKAVLESAYKKATGAKYSTVYDGVDYAPVYNYTYYKKKYPTVAKALGTDKQKYFDNFIEYGMKAGRQGSAAFNVKNYKKRYEDLRNAFGDNLPEYYKHYCVYGKKEKRNAK